MVGLMEVLKWLISGGSGAVAYWLMEKVKALAALEPEPKRYVSLAISGAVAVLAFLAQVGMGYQAAPLDARAWIETLFAVVGVAMGIGQILHGALKLRNRA